AECGTQFRTSVQQPEVRATAIAGGETEAGSSAICADRLSAQGALGGRAHADTESAERARVNQQQHRPAQYAEGPGGAPLHARAPRLCGDHATDRATASAASCDRKADDHVS